MKRIVNLLAAVMMVIGFVILINPYWCDYQLRKENDKVISEFIESASKKVSNPANDSSSEEYFGSDTVNYFQNTKDYTITDDTMTDSSMPDNSMTEQISVSEDHYSELFSNMQEYNRRIYDDNQTELRDAFSYTTSDFDFESYGLPNNVAGYITIESMNIRLALYIGSSIDNMSRGATVMNQTSMPIGGINTNCVIAAHRSRGFFGDIEKLKIGDIVKVTNLWEELSYRVVKIIVIDPYDVEKVKIFPEQDMVTLLTCHPYTVNSHRYVVYCVRDSEAVLAQNSGQESQASHQIPPEQTSDELQENKFIEEAFPPSAEFPEWIAYNELPDGIFYESSEESIKYENIVRLSGIALTGFFLLTFLIMFIKRVLYYFTIKGFRKKL